MHESLGSEGEPELHHAGRRLLTARLGDCAVNMDRLLYG